MSFLFYFYSHPVLQVNFSVKGLDFSFFKPLQRMLQ